MSRPWTRAEGRTGEDLVAPDYAMECDSLPGIIHIYDPKATVTNIDRVISMIIKTLSIIPS